MKKLLQPKIFVPIVFAAVLIGVVLSLGDIRKVGGAIVHFPHGDAAIFFLLTVLYELVRGWQWWYFIHRQGIRVGFRRATFSFVGGEAAKSLPAGNYFQDYLLEREKGVAVAYSAASTTVTVLLEVLICLLYLAIVGITGWTWLRPLLILGMLGFATVVFVILRLDLHAHAPERLKKTKVYQWIGDQWQTFLKGAKSFVSPKTLAFGFTLAVVYLALAGMQYYVVIRALGIGNISVWHAVSAYLFGLGAGLILPVPTDIGVQEITGVGALHALGVSVTQAVSISIIFRILNVVTAIVIAIITSAILRKEFREALSSRQGSGKIPGDPNSGTNGEESSDGQSEQRTEMTAEGSPPK